MMFAVPKSSVTPVMEAPSSGELNVASGLRQPEPSTTPASSAVAVTDPDSPWEEGVVSSETVGIAVGREVEGTAVAAKVATTNVAKPAASTRARIAAERVSFPKALSLSSPNIARRISRRLPATVRK